MATKVKAMATKTVKNVSESWLQLLGTDAHS